MTKKNKNNKFLVPPNVLDILEYVIEDYRTDKAILDNAEEIKRELEEIKKLLKEKDKK